MNEAMMVVGLLVAVLGWMTWEDTRYRAISLWTFPVLFATLLLSKAYFTSWAETFWALKINLAMVVFQCAAVWLYLIAKHRTLVNPLQGFIGLGDVLFWLALLPAFSPINFLLFYVVSLSAALLAHVCFRQRALYGDPQRVPLAGLQALVYAAWLLVYGLNDSPTWLATL